MPTVRKLQAARAQGRTHRAQAASMRPSTRAATPREGRRKADIAGVQEGRMHRQGGILKQGIEGASLHRRIRQPDEGIGGQDRARPGTPSPRGPGRRPLWP
jgi:hypothetical protein